MENMNNNMNDNLNNINDNNDQDNKKDKKKMSFKKGAGIALCAVLAGGLAFEGVSAVSGWDFSNIVQASDKDENKTTLLKTKKKSDDKDTEKTEEKTEDSKDKDEKAEEDSEQKVKGSLDVSDIAAEAMKSVVAINTKSVQEVQTYIGDFGFGGFTTQEQEVEGSGSGIIVGKNDESLLIATNYHVIQGADTVSVTCIDGEVYEAIVNGYDADKDLAVVSVALSDISKDTMEQIEVATVGSSDDLRVGEQVVAIGNALGYGQSVTTGIVSAKNRKLDDSGQADENSDGVNLIQTDAAINPGNSGGALLNANGEVIGINSAKIATETVEGIGYAIPVSDVSDLITNLMNQKTKTKVAESERGYIGIKGVDVTSDSAQMYNMPTGVYVSEVISGGGAEKAGITKGAVITGIEGTTVDGMDALQEQLQYYKAGEKVKITVQTQSKNGEYEKKDVEVTLGKQSE